jgi:hypothetical protein
VELLSPNRMATRLAWQRVRESTEAHNFNKPTTNNNKQPTPLHMFSRLQYVILAVIFFMANFYTADAYAIPTRRQFFQTSATVATETVILPQAQPTVMVAQTRERLLDVLFEKIVEGVLDSQFDDN